MVKNEIDNLYNKKAMAINKIIGKKFIYEGIEIKIESIYMSMFNNINFAYVKDNMGQLFIVDIKYDYKNNIFIPVGDYSLPY